MKKVAAFIITVCCLCALVGCAYTPSDDKNDPEVTATPTKDTSEVAIVPDTQLPAEADDSYFEATGDFNGDVTEIDTAMVALLVSKGYTLEQAGNIQQILNTIGIESIDIQSMTGAADGLNAVICYPNGYTDDEHKFHFTTDGGVLFYAGFLGEDLYDDELGGFVKSYDDVHIPETSVDADIFSALQVLAERDVKACLSHPSNADFQNLSWAVGRSDDHYKIIGTVTAINSFGVKDDLHFAVWYIVSVDSFTLEGIEIDGTRVK